MDFGPSGPPGGAGGDKTRIKWWLVTAGSDAVGLPGSISQGRSAEPPLQSRAVRDQETEERSPGRTGARSPSLHESPFCFILYGDVFGVLSTSRTVSVHLTHFGQLRHFL